jgi:ATP-dependent DNA ligase
MLTPPIEPMLASPLGNEVPTDATGLSFEPKWDGFRCLVFRGADDVVLQGRGRSRSSSEEVIDLAYAFPEVVAACLTQVAPGTVLDAEIVIPEDGRLDFGVLTSRLRPRSEAGGPSIANLASQHPASLLVFDVLWSGRDRRDDPFVERRAALVELSAGWTAPILLTPNTTDVALATTWFHEFEAAGVDGLMVKRLADVYVPGKRTQGKVKHLRSADVVIGGWRPHTKPGLDGAEVVGSLLLGLHDDGHVLQYVGVASAFTRKVRAELIQLVAPYSVADGDPHPWRGEASGRVPGGATRWKKEQPWRALRPELVAEVTYDQLEGDRFRHVAGFVRWRPDRGADTCGYGQLQTPPPARIDGLLDPG